MKTSTFHFALCTFRLFAISLLSMLLNYSVAGQSLICPQSPPSGTTMPVDATPFSTDWKNNLTSGQKLIPVVVHLTGGTTGLSLAQVQTAIDGLNADFHSTNLDFPLEKSE